jgi:subtilisin family serine protease
MKIIKLIVVAMFLITCVTAKAIKPTYDHEILTMFVRGTVELPEGQTSVSINEAIFEPSEISGILRDHTAETISLAFPDYRREDSIFVSPEDPNLRVKQMELDIIYKIYLSNPDKRNTLNDELLTYEQTVFSQNNGTATMLTNDFWFDWQWALEDSFDYDIDAPQAWELEHGEPRMTIGIVDEGVQLDHEDLTPKISGDGTTSNHGTHVAGIAAAQTNNDIGVAGVNWNTRIYSRNIIGLDYPALYNVILDICSQPTIRVFNNSWYLTQGDNILVHKAFALAYDVRKAPVAARGNFFDDRAIYPAC